MIFNYWFTVTDALIMVVAVVCLLGIVQGFINLQTERALKELEKELEMFRKVTGVIK